MKSLEPRVLPKSEYYIHYASQTGKDAFFYPVHVGHFYYEAGYSQSRSSFDSFLLMYILEGEVVVEYGTETVTVRKGQFVFLDCYKPHAYYSDQDYESLWIHFDGQNSRHFFEMITGNIGNVFIMDDPIPVINRISRIFEVYHQGQPIREVWLSRQIYDMLCDLCLYSTTQAPNQTHSPVIETVTAYINEHFKEDPSIETLAAQTNLSSYYFIRIFRKETGMTPHEYIINLKMDFAKYLLKKTNLSIKDICYECGFRNVSVFCAAFRKMTGQTPTAFRKKDEE
ncbi:MAG: AraC family transcriptional regulator [Lachnospiraceae bacterium]|nr:AraC family transcriptional regulator [Lachnospiraceae bacterium]